VIFPQPKSGEIFPALIFGDLLGRKVGVIVDNRLNGGDFVIEAFRSLAVEQEVVVQECARHGGKVGTVAWTGKRSARGAPP
jgi:hypothetical protein